MREYSPKRRTAVVLTGSGASGAYHAGVLKALDETGVKVDLLVGSGVGTVGAALGAVAGGARLYGPGGFWEDVAWGSFYRLRAVLRVAALLLACSFLVFVLPVLAALVAGLLFPLVLVADLAVPGLEMKLLPAGWSAAALRTPFLAALSLPIFLLALVALLHVLRVALRDRRRVAEGFESILDATPARERLAEALWEAARGAAPAGGRTPAAAEIGRLLVALAAENLGQPGFRELVLRCADLDTGGPLVLGLLDDRHRQAFFSARRGARNTTVLDLRAPGHDALAFDAVFAGLLPPLAAPVHRLAFPRGGPHGGEVHRIGDGGLVAGCGIAEALAAGAEQVLVVSAVPEEAALPPRRRGPLALADAAVATLERRAVDEDVRAAERINRMVETLGHRTEDGGAWQDPASGRVFRSVALWVVRPDHRSLGPLELDGARDPRSEVLETPDDLLERGHRDAYRLFVEPVVGAAPEARPAPPRPAEGHPVEL